ncbi:MAG: cell division protein FtsZ [Actinomycetota bacterium]|nr:cell division protein FtsZ [Actinomycetota bacterium]
MIKVIGIGGAGNNAINHMIKAGLENVHYIGINTDNQALQGCLADVVIPIGREVTHGLSAGNEPEVGAQAARQSEGDIRKAIKGADLVFVVAGKGGGTGTGAAPVVARIAKSLGALTIGVVTKPFAFEGPRRMLQAEEGIRKLEENLDSVIVISNDLLFAAEEGRSILDAFGMADETLLQVIRLVISVICKRGIINLDFADVRRVLENSGYALVSKGLGVGEEKGRQAAISALESPLLEYGVGGATRVLLSISGGRNLSLFEVNEAVEVVARAVDPRANMVFGAVLDESLGDRLELGIIASGFKGFFSNIQRPANISATREVALPEEQDEATFPEFTKNP